VFIFSVVSILLKLLDLYLNSETCGKRVFSDNAFGTSLYVFQTGEFPYHCCPGGVVTSVKDFECCAVRSEQHCNNIYSLIFDQHLSPKSNQIKEDERDRAYSTHGEKLNADSVLKEKQKEKDH
jgi:hypothetical protein